MLLKDAAGDALVFPVGGSFPNFGSPVPDVSSQGPANIDIRGVFFNYAPGADGKQVLTANIQVEDLTEEIPEEAREGFIRYYIPMDATGDVMGLNAVLSEDGWEFTYTQVLDIPDPLGYTDHPEEQPTTGRVFLGKNGVIQIDMPASGEVAEGTELKGVYARTALGNNSVLFVSDQAPDNGASGAVDFKVKSCPVVDTTTTTVDTTTVQAPVAPVAAPQAPAAAPSAPAAAKVSKRAACLKKAKKIKNKRKRAKAVKRCKRLKK
jgi:hypothetical protein